MMKVFMKYYAQPAFLLCVALLALVALGMSLGKSWLSLRLQKEPIALKRSFDEFDESSLGPFTIVEKIRIQSNDIVDSLGTDDYLQWILVDSDADPKSPAGTLLLFITYYGKADSVPHVPEECYTGGGYRKVHSDPVTFEVAGMADSDSGHTLKIPGRYVTFKRSNPGVWAQNLSFPVLYSFNVNGTYANTRTDARLILGKNIRGKHSYFCKVEMVFNRTKNTPDQASAIATCEKLLSVLLPVLERDYWPDVNELMGY